MLNHVTDSERVFAFRALWFARGFDNALPSYDQNIAVSTANADRILWATHIEEFRRVRLVLAFQKYVARGMGERGFCQ